MPLTAREAALSALIAYRQRDARPDIILANLSKQGKIEKLDMALAANITNGVLQNRELLDYYISTYSTTAPGKLEPAILDILRISIYQLAFLSRVPSHAAVSEGVELSKKYSKCAFGLVNAVLRRVAENRNKLPEVKGVTETERISIKYSHPMWLVSKLEDEYGLDACEKILICNNTPAPITIQVNTLKTTTEKLSSELADAGVECSPHPFLPDALYISANGALDSLEQFKNGSFYVQDTAARLAVLAAAPKPGETLLDVCSAPGGKAFASAIAMGDSGKILSSDIHENKLTQIKSGAERLGIHIIETSAGDARAFNSALENTADVLIADVPCSGFGVIRKKPEIRYKNEQDLARLPEIQLSILNNVCRYVKTGGTLLYSTCTILRRENQDVINEFLSQHENFKLERFELPEPFGSSDGMSVLLPHTGNTDGFFICRMKRLK